MDCRPFGVRGFPSKPSRRGCWRKTSAAIPIQRLWMLRPRRREQRLGLRRRDGLPRRIRPLRGLAGRQFPPGKSVARARLEEVCKPAWEPVFSLEQAARGAEGRLRARYFPGRRRGVGGDAERVHEFAQAFVVAGLAGWGLTGPRRNRRRGYPARITRGSALTDEITNAGYHREDDKDNQLVVHGCRLFLIRGGSGGRACARSRDGTAHLRVGFDVFHPHVIHDPQVAGAERLGHGLRAPAIRPPPPWRASPGSWRAFPARRRRRRRGAPRLWPGQPACRRRPVRSAVLRQCFRRRPRRRCRWREFRTPCCCRAPWPSTALEMRSGFSSTSL